MAITFLPSVLTRDVEQDSPAPDPGNPPNIVQVEYPCKGIVEDYSDFYKLQSLVQANERKILVLANSLATVPQENDKITIRGKTYTVVSVGSDPALATYELKATS